MRHGPSAGKPLTIGMPSAIGVTEILPDWTRRIPVQQDNAFSEDYDGVAEEISPPLACLHPMETFLQT
jgi:hypothetical protein